MGAEESVIQPGALSLRMKFDDFTGLFVMHCHRNRATTCSWEEGKSPSIYRLSKFFVIACSNGH